MVQRDDGEDVDLVDGLQAEAVLFILDSLGAREGLEFFEALGAGVVGGPVAREFLRGVEVAAHGEGASGFDVGCGGAAAVEVDGFGVEGEEAGADLAG